MGPHLPWIILLSCCCSPRSPVPDEDLFQEGPLKYVISKQLRSRTCRTVLALPQINDLVLISLLIMMQKQSANSKWQVAIYRELLAEWEGLFTLNGNPLGFF